MPQISIDIDGDDLARMFMDSDADDIERFGEDLAGQIAAPDLDPFVRGFFSNLTDDEFARVTSLLQAAKDERTEFAKADEGPGDTGDLPLSAE